MTPRILRISIAPGSNAYLLDTEIPVIIDAGHPQHSDEVFNLLSKQYDLSKIKYIVCTHLHPDHTGAAGVLKNKTGAQILSYTPQKNLKITTTHRNLLNFPLEDIKPDAFLGDGETISLGNDSLRVIFTPGHADDHICLFLEGSKILFTGDLITYSDIGYLNLNHPFKDSLSSLKKSISSCEQLKPKYLLPGHGDLLVAEEAIWKNLKRKTLLLEKNPFLSVPHMLLSPILFFISTQKTISYEICEKFILSYLDSFEGFIDNVSPEVILSEFQKLITLLRFKNIIKLKDELLSIERLSDISSSIWLNEL